MSERAPSPTRQFTGLGDVERLAPYLLGVLRIMTALLFLEHALVKVIGFPPGAAPGPQSLTSFFGIAGLIELVGGVLLTLGLFTRPVAFLMAGEMAVGYFTV